MKGSGFMAFATITLKNGGGIPLIRSIPMVAVHVACLAAFFLGFRWSYLIVCLALYYVRMLFVTAGYLCSARIQSTRRIAHFEEPPE